MTRELEVRYRILRDGADLGELRAASRPTLRCDSSASIKMSMQGDFLPNDQINWLRDEIQPILVINGVEHPLAMLMPASAAARQSGTSTLMRVEAYDRCWRVQDYATESALYIAAGANYVEEIKKLVIACGIDIVLATPSDAVFAEDREEWEIGTDYLTIVNQLLSEINYKALWFNAAGAAILEPATVPSADELRHVLDEADVKSLLLPGMNRETDYFRTPNVFICLCDNPDKSGPMIARAENTNPQSPLSIARRGRKLVRAYHVDNIEDQDALDAYAARLCSESMIGGETITVTTALLPDFGVRDVMALQYGDISDLCVESAWTMELGVGGSMTHMLERVVVNLG